MPGRSRIACAVLLFLCIQCCWSLSHASESHHSKDQIVDGDGRGVHGLGDESLGTEGLHEELYLGNDDEGERERDEELFGEGGKFGRGGTARVDASMAGLSVYAALLEPFKAPVKAVFACSLLLYGRDFAHLILFLQAFKVAGYPTVSSGISRVTASYSRFMATQDPREVYPWAALTANIDPHAVNSLVWGAFTGATACIGAVVSPMVGATFVGLSLGQSADRHVQPFVRENLSRFFPRGQEGFINNVWMSYAIKSCSQACCVAAALVNVEIVSIFSGSLIGAHLITDMSIKNLHGHIKRFARRSDHALLQRAAENFNPKHKSVHAIKYAVAVVAFMAQLGKLPGTMSLPFRLFLALPLAVEKGLASIKDALIHRSD